MSKEDWPEYHKQYKIAEKDLIDKIRNAIAALEFQPPIKSQSYPWDSLTSKQRMVLKCLNPYEYGFTQKETAIYMGVSERTVNSIFKSFRKQFPEEAKEFDRIKKSMNKFLRKGKKPLLCGSGNHLWVGNKIKIGNKYLKVLEKF